MATKSALDMAKRLGIKNLQQIALEVAILNKVAPLKPPISLKAVMKLFAKVAAPEPPKNLVNNFIFPTESPTLSPIFSDVTWQDASAKTFRYATKYFCRLELGYGSGYAVIGESTDVWVTEREIVFQFPLDFDTDYKANIYAANDWGHSEWSWIKFTTYSNPNPPSTGPVKNPPPKKTPQPSGFHFWNCSEGDGDTSVTVTLKDLTSGASWTWNLNSDYDPDSQGCGPGYNNAQVITSVPPGQSLQGQPSLKAGDQYQWTVEQAGTIQQKGSFTAGSDAPINIVWPD